MHKTTVRFLIIMLCTINTNAAVYMHEDANKNIVYSDTPIENAKEIEIPATTSSISSQSTTTHIDKTEAAPNLPAALPDKPGKLVYTDLAITSPQDNQTFQNQLVVPVIVKVSPKLQEKDKIQLVVDGVLWGAAVPNTNLSVTDLSRGTHSISAVLMDDQGKVILSSNTISIFYHRASAQTNKNAP